MLLSDQPKINFAFGVHCHQPFGNWDWVIEEAYQQSYLPFVETVERHPGVRVMLHYTGFLLEWLLEHHPDFIARVKLLVEKGQAELVTGGFYAPVLAVIPDEDKVMQIRHLSRTLRDNFGQMPEGLWLAERVWEPHLTKFIADSGVRWMPLDDSIFRAAGLRGHQLLGYYQTEEQGKTLEVVPINSELSRLIPFAPPERVIDYLRANASTDGNRLAFCFDDGEKFGVWPNTHKAIFEQGWLDRLFGLLEEHSDWIVSTTLHDYRRERRPFGRIYLPSATYVQMQEWALPPDEALAYAEALTNVNERYVHFLRGGMWRNFLVRYPESNNLHKKMLLVADKVAEASGVEQLVTASVESEATDDWDEAQTALWQGQSNDPYWHGVFGGLYLTHLRSANYRALIKAEAICDRLIHRGEDFLEVREQDFDCDGKPEILISTKDQNLYFNLEGGALFELDYKPASFNVLDTLARRHEAYHSKIARATTLEAFRREGSIRAIYDVVLTKEQGLEKFLFHDWYRRLSFLDHFLHPDSHLESFYNMSFGEQGDFVNQEYRPSIERTADGVALTLSREGHVWVGSEFWPVTVSKRFAVAREGGAITHVDYTLTNGKDRPVSLWFGVEFNANFLAGNAPDRYYYVPGKVVEDPRLGSKGELHGVTEAGIRDAFNGIDYHLRWDRPATLWRFPVETISMSEGGFERVYQSSVLMPHWHLELGPSSSLALRFEQHLSGL
ncbi:MAG TPA: alpha-amylase/4-alpha-glucanotransferase domain-containing protein [Stenomitos sp.]